MKLIGGASTAEIRPLGTSGDSTCLDDLRYRQENQHFADDFTRASPSAGRVKKSPYWQPVAVLGVR